MVGNLGKGLGTVNLVEEWEKGLGTVNLVGEWEKGLGTVNSMGVWGREHGPGASVEDWDDKPNRPHYQSGKDWTAKENRQTEHIVVIP